MTSNNSASLLLPLERARDSTLCQTKAEKTLVICHIKYHFVHSLESQALQFQLPACLVDQILQKTTGRIHVITFSKKYCSLRKRCLLLNVLDAENNLTFFLKTYS